MGTRESEGQDLGQHNTDSEGVPPVSYGGAALLLQYSQLRSSWLVGRALAETFPTEAAWLAAMNDPALQEALSSFGQLREELEHEQLRAATPEELIHIGELHMPRALECIEAFAARIGVAPSDVLLVSM